MKKEVRDDSQESTESRLRIKSMPQHFVFPCDSPSQKDQEDAIDVELSDNKNLLISLDNADSQEDSTKGRETESSPINDGKDFRSPKHTISTLDTTYNEDESILSSPGAPFDKDDVFFASDEMGEVALGYFDDGVDYYNICWSYDREKDCKDTKRIRRNIAKSITPKSSTISLSPRGVMQEMDINAVEWYEQQQYHRQSFSKLKTPKLEQERVFMQHIRSPKWLPWNQSSPHSIHATECEEETSSYSESDFEFNDDVELPDSPPVLTPELRKGTNEDEVRSSLPEPETNWYTEFYGSKQTHQVAFVTTQKNKSPDLLSRFSFRKTSSNKNLSAKRGLQIPAALRNALNEEELLFLGGYRDHGEGLHAC